MLLPNFPSPAMLLKALAACQGNNFRVLVSQVHYAAEDAAAKSAHGKIFSADRTTACGKEVKANQVPPHSPILPTVRAKGL